jgi:hypothetical protein
LATSSIETALVASCSGKENELKKLKLWLEGCVIFTFVNFWRFVFWIGERLEKKNNKEEKNS